MLGELPLPGRPTNLDNSRARAYCARCGWGRYREVSLPASHYIFVIINDDDWPILI